MLFMINERKTPRYAYQEEMPDFANIHALDIFVALPPPLENRDV